LVINIENICDRAIELFNPGGASGSVLADSAVDCCQLSKDASDKMHKKRICSQYVHEAARLAAEAILAGEDTDA